MWNVLRVLAGTVIGYALVVLVLQRAVSFPGQFRSVDRDEPPEGVRRIWLEASFGRVEAWLYEAERPGARPPSTEPTAQVVGADRLAPAVLYFHGNGELIDDWDPEMRRLAASGVTAVAVEFPGYGRSEGKPSRSSIREVAALAYDRVVEEPTVDERRIVSWGRSMGGGAAADLALDRPVAALVLQSTFSSTMAMARTILVPGFLVRDRFAPERVVGRYAGPVLLMHGPTDEVIPYAQAQRTAAARPGLEIVDLPCGHNDCVPAWPEIMAHALDFLQREGLRH